MQRVMGMLYFYHGLSGAERESDLIGSLFFLERAFCYHHCHINRLNQFCSLSHNYISRRVSQGGTRFASQMYSVQHYANTEKQVYMEWCLAIVSIYWLTKWAANQQLEHPFTLSFPQACSWWSDNVHSFRWSHYWCRDPDLQKSACRWINLIRYV